MRFDDDEYDVGDLVLLALAEGRWQQLEARLARGLALEREHGYEVGAGRVADALKQFRYARRLIAGKELRDWLAGRSLTLDDVRRHSLRNILLEEYGEDGERVAAAALAEVLDSEAVISGLLSETATRLGDLAAMAAATHAIGEPPEAAVFTLVAEAAAHPGAGLNAVDAAELVRRVARMLRLLSAEEGFVRDVATPDAMRRCLAENGVDWLRVECEELTLEAEGAARESMLCLRVDGTPLASLSEQLGLGVGVGEHYLGDLTGDSVAGLASAAIGEPVGPFATDDGWRVLVVRSRVAPTSEDPELARRATAAIVNTARERIKAGRVRELAGF